MIGLTVVAVGTSMPELVVSVDAALAGTDDIAVGNVHETRRLVSQLERDAFW